MHCSKICVIHLWNMKRLMEYMSISVFKLVAYTSIKQNSVFIDKIPVPWGFVIDRFHYVMYLPKSCFSLFGSATYS
jgi:hypothetical protein